MPMFVSAGSISRHATSSYSSTRSSESTSLNSATLVVSVGSSAGPTSPARARERPCSSRTTNDSSTEPW